MKNILAKFFIYSFIILSLIIFYLSFFGISTSKFNKSIKDSFLKNNEILLVNINEIKIKLYPFKLTTKLTTKDVEIKINSRLIKLNEVRSEISLISLIKNEQQINNLEIKSGNNDLKSIIEFIKVYQNNFKIIFIDKFLSNGQINFDLKVNFDENGKPLQNFIFNGSIKNLDIKLINGESIRTNFDFNVNNNKYIIKKSNWKYDKLILTSDNIVVNKYEKNFEVNGDINNNSFEASQNFLDIFNIKLPEYIINKTFEFSSNNNFSFDLSKKFKISNLNIETDLKIKKIIFKSDTSLVKNIFKNKKNIEILNNYFKIKINKQNINKEPNDIFIDGLGDILINNIKDKIEYKLRLNDSQKLIDIKLNLKNNPINLDVLNFEKAKGISSTFIINAQIKKNNKINIKEVSLESTDNTFYFKDLIFDKNLKFKSLSMAKFNFKNKQKLKNILDIQKNQNNYYITGKSISLYKLLDKFSNSDNTNTFMDLDKTYAKIFVNIGKFYIDNKNYINNLNGEFVIKNNKIFKSNLDGFFPNKEKISLNLKTIKNEKVTTLVTNYPAPLLERYKFIKGFSEGIFDLQSISSGNKSNTIIIIDNFKVKEVPVLAKILTLASLQGIADLLTGEGIRFTDFEMNFNKNNNIITIEEIYAIGPAISLMMEGYIDKGKLISLRGTLVPATTINRTISSIPVLGDILVGKKVGEGVFGVSFKIKGPPNNLKTTVNPIKTLTPRFITRTLEKIKN